MSILQMRKLRLREGEGLAQGHTARRQWSRTGSQKHDCRTISLGWVTWLGWGWVERAPRLSGTFHPPGAGLSVF